MEKMSKGVEYILRCAIAKGGSVGYNPYMSTLEKVSSSIDDGIALV